MGRADAAIPAWIAGERNRVSRQELTEEEEEGGGTLHESLASAAKERELDGWKKSKVSQP